MNENLLLLRDLLEAHNNIIYKHVTSVSKNVYIDELDGIVQKYNNNTIPHSK